MHLKNEKKSFWASLPGILTGIAAVLTAIVAITSSLSQIGVFGGNDHKNNSILSSPIPQKPACGSIIRSLSDTKHLVLGWQPVDGASTYTVEADCFGCSQYPNSWYSQSGAPWHVKTGLGLRTLQNPIYSSMLHESLKEAGGKSLRWRVWAVNSKGHEGKKSNWCQLAFFGNPK